MNPTELAVILSLAAMAAFALAAVFRGQGYAFDMRRKGTRRRDPNRAGGRREDDRTVAI